jgi:CVNH domain
MSRLLIGLVAGLGLAASALAPASAQAVPSGSYQQSCTNIRVRGNQLTARCTNTQGVAVRSTIALNSCRNGDIGNSNGQLTCLGANNGYGNGNHRRHHNGQDNGYGNGGYNNGHHGDNDRNNGGYNNGGYNNGGYNNGGYNNGRYNNGAAPGGSYQSSCTNVQMSGSTLSATCTSPNGGSITSSINASRCRGMDIANLNGRLVCR